MHVVSITLVNDLVVCFLFLVAFFQYSHSFQPVKSVAFITFSVIKYVSSPAITVRPYTARDITVSIKYILINCTYSFETVELNYLHFVQLYTSFYWVMSFFCRFRFNSQNTWLTHKMLCCSLNYPKRSHHLEQLQR